MTKLRIVSALVAGLFVAAAGAAEIEYLRNGSFSDGTATPESWSTGEKSPLTLVRDTQVYRSGPASARIEIPDGANAGSVTQPLTQIPKGEFRLNLWSRAEGPAKVVKYDLQVLDAAWKQLAWFTSEDHADHKLRVNGQWQQISRAFRFPEGTAHVLFLLAIEGEPGAKWWVDDVRIDAPNPAADSATIRSTPAVQVVGQEPYVWRNAVMGGVEYATGVVWSLRHPEHLFIRADGGGIWKLDRSTGERWINLSDNIPYRWGSMVTADSLAVDPDDPATIYVAGGGRWAELHDVIKTTDGGKTWSRTNCRTPEGKPVTSDGNGDNKQVGERLIVDPNHPSTVYFATRNDGLMVSHDKAATWQRIESFTPRGGSWKGLSFVVLDPLRSRVGEPTGRMYVGVQPGERDGQRQEGAIYRSEDGGKTWQRLEGGPAATATPMRARIAPDGTFYVTVVGTGSWNSQGTGGGVWKLADGTWTDITPPSAKGKPFCGINLHPSDPKQILVAQTYGQSAHTFHYSRDGGKTWVDYRNVPGKRSESTVRIGRNVPWEKGEQPGWGGNAADIAFDTVRPEFAWHMSFSGPFRVTGIGQPEVRVDLIGEGREQITCADVVSPSRGAPLVSGVWDVGGFRHERLDEIPQEIIPVVTRDGKGNWGEKHWQDCFQIDVNPSHPDRLVSCGGWQWNMTGDACYSNDNARTWVQFPTKPFKDAKFGRIAMGTNPDNVVWAPMGAKDTPLYVTHDNGKSWKPAEGAPLGTIATDGPWSFYKLLAADRVQADTFYLYDRRDGRFYRSEDGGERWKHLSRLPSQQGAHFDNHRVHVNPYKAGDVWVSIQEKGLFHSPDGGASWEKVEGIPWVTAFNFGRGKTAGRPAIYLFGQIGDGRPTKPSEVDAALYRSDDLGRTWVKVNDDQQQFPQIAPGLCGDMQEWGRVYVTTSARGIFYGVPR